MVPKRDLTADKLLNYGFIEVDNRWPYDAATVAKEPEGVGNRFNWRTFRKKVPKRPDPYGYFMYDIQIEISDLLETNPNSGIISLYHEAFDCPAIPEDLHNKENWTEEDHERAKNFTIRIEERIQTITHFINTEERLKAIYEAITFTKLSLSLEGELEEALKNENFERVIEIRKILGS